MKSLFGISMDTIMVVMLIAFLIATALVAVLALINPLFFKMGLRNIPRRRAQTILIIVGLMLSTVIITSAFGTGDTVSYSVRSAAMTNLGFVDEAVVSTVRDGSSFGAAGAQTSIAGNVAASIAATANGNKDVDGVMSAVVQSAPLQDLTSGQTKNKGVLAGIPADYPASFGSLNALDGSVVRLGDLGPNEVFLNKRAGDALSAKAGDRLQLYVGVRSVPVTVRAILRNENMAAGGLLSRGQTSDPTVLMPLERAQALIGGGTQVSMVLISNRGDALSGAALTDGVVQQQRALLANGARVAAAQRLLATLPKKAGKTALDTLIANPASTGVKTKLIDLQQEVSRPGQSARLKGLLSDPDVIDALKGIKNQALVARPLNDALAGISDYGVQPLKQRGLADADLFGSIFTTIFVVFGLFSISAGVLLIFLIFVMLAAERRAEMGMARAVGTKRRHLIQQFLSEGYIYDLGAALVGVALGIMVGLGMVKIMAGLFGAADFTLQSHVEPRSLVVAFCLGALVTFLTVAFSSVRVSRLNIVAAIRDLPEDFGTGKTMRDAWDQTIANFAAVRRSKLRIALWLIALPAMLLRGLGVGYLVLRLLWYVRPLLIALFARGVIPLLVGYPLAAKGIQDKKQFWFTMGVSLLIIGAAMLLRWILGALRMRDALRNRIAYSLAGLGLVIYWLLPFDALKRFGVPDLDGGIEMFFVSGIMLVLGGVWTVMFNSDLILGALMRIFGSNGKLAPSLKTAVTYPMQYKFRTGLTLAMFSLVIFTLMVMSVLTGSTAGSLKLARDTGNWQIYGQVNPNNPIRNIGKSLAAEPTLKGVAVGGIAKIDIGLRQPGQENQSWRGYTANVVDRAYISGQGWSLATRARGYGSDSAVLQKLRTPGYAVVDSTLVPSKNGGSFDSGRFTISGFNYEDKAFAPPTIEMRDATSGKVVQLQVIGVLDQYAGNLDALTPGVYTGQETLVAAGLPAQLPNTYVFRAAPGADVHATALALGKTFLRNGLDVKEVKKEYDTNQSITIGLNNLLQAFMALGLVVGIAALGVIAFRSVVERRQQIGVMRAIGFQRSMIRTSFLLESSFVAILGTLLGVGLGLALAKNLVDSIAKTNSGITLSIPWAQIGLIVVVAYAASLATTYLPAWQASRIYPAEALRYE